MKSTQPVRMVSTPKNDVARSTDALVDALADCVAARVLERLASAGGTGGGPRGPEGPQLLDRAGLALALGVSVSTIDRLIAKGCPFVWVLDSKRFEFDKVKEWLYAKTG